MKPGWQRKQLGEMCGIASVLVDPREPSYSEMIHVGGANIESATGILQDLKTAKQEELKSGKFVFDETMVLYSKIRPYLMKVARPNFQGLCSADIYPLSPNSSQLDRDYLYYLLLSHEFTQFAISGSARSGMPKVNRDHIFKFHFVLPPIAEQRRVVGILDEAIDGIANAKVNTEKNLQNARALIESHLQTVFTRRGAGWDEKRLEEIAKVFGRGKSRHRPRNEPSLYGGNYPFVQTGDVRNADHFVESYSQTYNEKGLAQSKLWPAGTVCITIAANIAETAILGFDSCFPDSVIGVVVDESKTSNSFLLYLLQSFKAELKAQGKGSAQDNINMGTFEDRLFPFPSLEVQQELVSTLDSLREETQRLESIYRQKLSCLDALKKSLLHRAFSGQL
jgi:type I restriction enzyme, S subunit